MNISELKKQIDKINLENISKLKKIINNVNKIIILGNGGSNSIASHIAQDYTKVLGKKAISFSDASRLTCYINDYGMDNAYVKFIEHLHDHDTLVILISSSGNSINILNSAKFCVENNISIVILSGFDESNSLNKNFTNNSLLSFWVNSNDYGIVEILHTIILHSIL